jgi:hypothetical protein
MHATRLLTVVTVLGPIIGLDLFPPRLLAQETTTEEAPRHSRDLVTTGHDKLKIAKAVACRSIDGYERYVPLSNGAITAEEKLQIYYRVLHCKFAVKGDEYFVHLIQDGQIRRKGEKTVLRSKRKILDYVAKTSNRPDWIFLRNSVPLKGLMPGDYEYDIILRDEYNPGPHVLQTVRFRVVAPALPTESQSKQGGHGTG